jgi:DNA-binding beta-propeller fold protein YncE
LAGLSLAPASSAVVRNIVRPQPGHVNPLTSLARVPAPVNPLHRFIPNKAGKGTVYVSDAAADAVYGFAPTGGSPTYVVSSGLSEPQGLDTTKKNLYVANTNDSQILVFQPPSTTPVTTINDPGEYPAGVAVSADGSQIWVSNICSAPSCAKGNVSEFDSSGNLLQAIQCRNLARYYFLAIDKNGNVIVDGVDGFGTFEASEIAAGTNTCTFLTSITAEFPGGVRFLTNGDVVILDQDADTLTEWAAPNFDTAVQTSTISSSSVSDPVTFAFTKKDKDYWTANAGSANATEFPWPAGGTPINTLTGFSQPIGVAIQPPAKL